MALLIFSVDLAVGLLYGMLQLLSLSSVDGHGIPVKSELIIKISPTYLSYILGWLFYNELSFAC